MPLIRKSVELANQLRKNILSGTYGSEGGLPGIGELTKEHKLSNNTTIAALAILEGEGLVVRRGNSYYVNNLKFTMTHYIPPIHMRKQNYAKNIGSVERIELPEYIATRLRLGNRPEVVVRNQVTGEINDGDYKELPYKLSCHYYVLPVTDEQLQKMQNDPTYDVMWERPDVRKELRCHDEIASRQVTQDEADLLNIKPCTPANTIFVTISDMNHNLLFIQELVLSPRVTLMYDYVFKNDPNS